MVATQENGGVGGRRREPNAATQPRTDHRRTGFERPPSPCPSGSSPVTNRELQRNLSNAQSENLPRKCQPSFCLDSRSSHCLLLPIHWEASPPQLPALCTGIFLRSKPARFFLIPSIHLMTVKKKKKSGIFQATCYQSR